MQRRRHPFHLPVSSHPSSFHESFLSAKDHSAPVRAVHPYRQTFATGTAGNPTWAVSSNMVGGRVEILRMVFHLRADQWRLCFVLGPDKRAWAVNERKYSIMR